MIASSSVLTMNCSCHWY